MEIYVANLPVCVEVEDLQYLFEKTARTSLLSALLWRLVPRPRHDQPQFRVVESKPGVRYGYVSGYSKTTGIQLIARLRDASLYGERLEVRAFVQRSFFNDRRRSGEHFRCWLGNEQRQCDRRRHHYPDFVNA